MSRMLTFFLFETVVFATSDRKHELAQNLTV